MYEIHIKGFTSKAQAEEFVKWYEGQGEQDSAIWFGYRHEEGKIDTDWMGVDMKSTYPLTWDNDVLPMVLDIK